VRQWPPAQCRRPDGLIEKATTVGGLVVSSQFCQRFGPGTGDVERDKRIHGGLVAIKLNDRGSFFFGL
jgi:hypothetical protein